MVIFMFIFCLGGNLYDAEQLLLHHAFIFYSVYFSARSMRSLSTVISFPNQGV